MIIVAELMGLPWWMNLVGVGGLVVICLFGFLESDPGLKCRDYISKWLHGWQRIHSEWVVFSAIEEVKPVDLISSEMKGLIEEHGGRNAVKISSTGYIDWYAGLWDEGIAYKHYTLWVQPKQWLE